jgi:putative transposase
VPEHWALLTLHERWKILAEALAASHRQQNFVTHAFVMMSTHFHFLFSSQGDNENFVMEVLQQNLKARLELSAEQAAIEYPALSEKVTTYRHLLHVYRYIYRNPIEAGLVSEAENYPYSTLPELLGRQPAFYDAQDPLSLIQHPQRILSWVNGEKPDILWPGYLPRSSSY